MKRRMLLLASLLMIFLLKSPSHVSAQAPPWLWATNAGYNSYDEAYSVANDAFGNSWVAGYYNTYIFDLPLSKGPDAFIATFDANGGLTWTGGICDTGAERITNIAFDKLGNYYLLGLFDGNILDLYTSHMLNSNPSATDIFIAKFDSQHNFIWARSAGGTDQDTPAGLVVDSLGNCYITGYFNSPSITFGAFPLTNSGGGNADIFLAKYSPDGTVLWARSATGTTGGMDLSKSVAIDRLGNSYITGYFNSVSLAFDGIVIEKGPNIDMYIAKYSPSGSALWAVPVSSTGDSYGYAVTVDPQDNYYVAGSFKNNLTIGDTTFTSAGARDVFLVKYAPDQSVLWARAAGSTLDDEPWALCTDDAGYCYLSGTYKSASVTFGSWPLTNNSNSGFSDIFITEYEPYGNVAWAKSIGGLTNDNPNALVADQLRNITMAASLGSVDITIGDTTLYNAGTVDALIVRSGNTPASGISNADVQTHTTLYPNPARDFINLNSLPGAEISVINMQGQVCRVIHSATNTIRIDISDLRPGIYLVNIRSGQSLSRMKFVKM